MIVFWIDEETGSGVMRRAKEGESLMDFVRETFKDEDLIRGMTHRWPDPDDDEDEWREYRPETWFKLEQADAMEFYKGWQEAGEDNPTDFRAPKVLEVIVDGVDPFDGGTTVMWVRAEVPDDTRYIYDARGAATDLDDYCGMGGGGYVSFKEEDK